MLEPGQQLAAKLSAAGIQKSGQAALQNRLWGRRPAYVWASQKRHPNVSFCFGGKIYLIFLGWQSSFFFLAVAPHFLQMKKPGFKGALCFPFKHIAGNSFLPPRRVLVVRLCVLICLVALVNPEGQQWPL